MRKDYTTIIGVIFLLLFVFCLMFFDYKINKNICEKNGGKYIFSFNRYETKCHYHGDK